MSEKTIQAQARQESQSENDYIPLSAPEPGVRFTNQRLQDQLERQIVKCWKNQDALHSGDGKDAAANDWLGQALAYGGERIQLAYSSLAHWIRKHYADQVEVRLNIHVAEQIESIIDRAVSRYAANTVCNEFDQNKLEILYKRMKGEISRVSYALDTQDQIVIPHTVFKGQINWFLDAVFSDLHTELQRLDNSKRSEQLYVAGLVFFGFVFGQLRPTHRRFNHNISVLLPLLPSIERYLPKKVLEEIHKSDIFRRSEGQKELQSFWQEAFVQYWVAKARVEGEAETALTQVDAAKARALLGTDARLGHGSQVGSTHATNLYARTGSIEQVKRFQMQENVAHQKVLSDQQQSRNRLIGTFTRLVAKYRGVAEARVFDNQLRPSPEFGILRQKSSQVLQVFIQHASSISANDLPMVRHEKFSICIEKMLQTLRKEEVSGRAVSVTSLFGTGFAKWSSLEQCALLVFSCLTVAENKNNALLKQAVSLVSSKLQPLIQKGEFYILEQDAPEQMEFGDVKNDGYPPYFGRYNFDRAWVVSSEKWTMHGADFFSVNRGEDKLSKSAHKQVTQLPQNTSEAKPTRLDVLIEKGSKLKTKYIYAASLLSFAAVFLIEGWHSVQNSILAIPFIQTAATELDANYNLFKEVIPEEKDVDAAKNEPVQTFATVHHIPDTVPEGFSGAFAYTVESLTDETGYRYTDEPIVGEFKESYPATISPGMHSAAPEEIVYEPEKIRRYMYPLEGYRFTKVYYQGGEPPEIGTAGTLIFSNGLPDRLLLVANPVTPTYLEGGGMILSDGSLPASEPWQDWSAQRVVAEELNDQLSSEPGLQQLHRELITELDALHTQTGGFVTVVQREQYVQIVIRHSQLFRQYIQDTRYYSLLYKKPNIRGAFPILRGMASSELAGFYCKVPNMGFQEYMQSVGVTALVRPGATAHIYEDQLLLRNTHLNSLVILPSGQLLSIDMTPSRVNPGEDLSFFDKPVVPPVEVQQFGVDEQESESLPLTHGLVALATTLVLAQGVRVTSRKANQQKRSYAERFDSYLPVDIHQKATIVRTLEQTVLMLLQNVRASSPQDENLKPAESLQRIAPESIAHDSVVLLSETANIEQFALKRTRLLFLGLTERLQTLKKSKKSSAITNSVLQYITDKNRVEIAWDLKIIRAEIKNEHTKLRNRLQVELRAARDEVQKLQLELQNHQESSALVEFTDVAQEAFFKVIQENQLLELRKSIVSREQVVNEIEQKIKKLHQSMQIFNNCLQLLQHAAG